MAREMEAVVGMEVETDSFMKELEDIFKQAANLIGDSMKGTGTGQALKNSTSEEEDSGKVLGGMGKTLKGIMGFVGKIFSGVVAASVFFRAFQPVMNLIESGVKLLSELLRPIADIMIILLQPLLAIIKPIVVAMRTLMAPFKKAAMQLSAEGTKAIMGGDVTAGIEMLMTSVGAMIGPFVTIVTAEALKLASNILLSGVEVLLNGILVLFAPVLQAFGVDIEATQAKISEFMGNARETVNEAITGLELNILTSMADNLNKKIDKMQEKFPTYAVGLENAKIDMENLFNTGIAGAFHLSNNMDDLKENMNTNNETEIFTQNMQKVRKELSKPLPLPTYESGSRRSIGTSIGMGLLGGVGAAIGLATSRKR